jgi:hypothetical protein
VLDNPAEGVRSFYRRRLNVQMLKRAREGESIALNGSPRKAQVLLSCFVGEQKLFELHFFCAILTVSYILELLRE